MRAGFQILAKNTAGQISCLRLRLKIARRLGGFRPSFTLAASYNSTADDARVTAPAGRFSEIGPKVEPPSADLTCCSPDIECREQTKYNFELQTS